MLGTRYLERDEVVARAGHELDAAEAPVTLKRSDAHDADVRKVLGHDQQQIRALPLIVLHCVRRPRRVLARQEVPVPIICVPCSDTVQQSPRGHNVQGFQRTAS